MRRFPLAAVLTGSSALGQSCGWSNAFGTRVLGAPDNDPTVYSQLVVDGGTAVIIGGKFSRAGSLAANSIARWDGSTFQTLGTGLTWDNGTPGQVFGLVSYRPSGSVQPLLIAGGSFSRADGAPASVLAAWDGTAWHAVPGSPTIDWLHSIFNVNFIVADPDGDGPLPESLIVALQLYYGAGPGSWITGQLWSWDGLTWVRLDPASNDYAGSMVTYAPPGQTPLLYTLGSNSSSGGCEATASLSLTRFDPTGRTRLISQTCVSHECGVPPCADTYYRQLVSFDADGAGPDPARLVLLGTFESVLGTTAHNIASFDGISWSEFAGGGIDGATRLFVLRDPTTGRPSLYASGNNVTVGGLSAPKLARYDATGWTAIPLGLSGTVQTMEPYVTPGSPPSIFVGGVTNVGVSVPGWSRLTPYGWSPVGQCLNNEVHALSVYAPQGKPASLYAGGAFTTAAGQLAVSLARWDGAAWHPAVNLNNHVDCMTTFGSSLALGGKFTLNGLSTGGVALFDGQSLTPLGTGMNTPVHALASFNGSLYAGGEFTVAGSVHAIGVARWNASAWSALGSGVNNHVDAMAVYDDGAGPALYIGGKFTAAGGQPAQHLARWTGSAWSSIPGGAADGNVEAMTVHDDGSGPGLYIGGDFTHVGGVPARIARYRAGAFTAIASAADGTIRALRSIDPDGPGLAAPLLAAGGEFTHIDAIAASHGALWDGRAWSGLLIGGPVYALAPFAPAGARPAMYFGGAFGSVATEPTSFIAGYTPCACYANCDGSIAAPVLNVNDFVCFLNLFAAGSPAANCDGSTTPPTLNVGDFTCFLNAFAAGCP